MLFATFSVEHSLKAVLFERMPRNINYVQNNLLGKEEEMPAGVLQVGRMENKLTGINL